MEVIKRSTTNRVERDSVFEILRRVNIPEQAAINELIDNSLDAKATQINITYDSRDIVITDNGFGMSGEVLSRAFDVGNHINKEATFGRYGYGLAQCTLRFADTVKVETSDGKEVSTRTVDVESYNKTSTVTTREQAQEQGTRLELRNHSFARYNKIIKDLAFYYGDLIQTGKLELTVNGEKVESKINRSAILQVDAQSVSIRWKGKKAEVTAGLLVDDLEAHLYKKYTGVTFIYNGKIIEYGITDLDAFAGLSVGEVAYFVELTDGAEKWLLSANKDLVMEKNEFFSDTSIRELISYWSKRGETKRKIIKMVELGTFITSLFRDLMGTRKRRSPEEETGTKEPRGTGRTRTDTEKQDPTRRNNSGTGFEWIPVINGDLMFLRYANKGIHMEVNTEHQNIELLYNNGEATKSHAMAILADFLATDHRVNKDALDEQFNGVTFPFIFEGLTNTDVRVSIDGLVSHEEGE